MSNRIKRKSKKNRRRGKQQTGDQWRLMVRETGDALVDMIGGQRVSAWWQTYRDVPKYGYIALCHLRKLQRDLRTGRLLEITEKHLPQYGVRQEDLN